LTNIVILKHPAWTNGVCPKSWGCRHILPINHQNKTLRNDHKRFLTGTAKILINRVISTKGVIFLVIDINNFYLSTPLGRFEYMVINLSSLPQEIIDKYNVLELAHDGRVYIEIQKGMYGLPQVGILANKL
jgi:hypothetical protein